MIGSGDALRSWETVFWDRGGKPIPVDATVVPLHINDTAEYVESPEVLRLLKCCGVDYGQGFYVSKPATSSRHLPWTAAPCCRPESHARRAVPDSQDPGSPGATAALVLPQGNG